ncbi:MAG: hypothetical protein JSW63_12665 [Ignavibacterium sp.]|nr:MAG: hypothetical protein JSW63_12665 [Ignavibacterium sp.]
MVNKINEAGNYEVNFNAAELARGIYSYQLRAGNPPPGSLDGQAGQGFVQAKKMLIIK